MISTATAQYVTNHAREQHSLDDCLQLSRRVDWRFLLPDPRLGHVAFCGPEHSALAEGLKMFSQSLTQVAPGQNGRQQYDLMVLHHLNAATIRILTQLVAPGGFLYLEVFGLLGPISAGGWLNRLHHPDRLIAMLRPLGFGSHQLHWHWPEFDHCASMIPFHDKAILYSMNTAQPGRSGFVKRALGRGLVRGGPLARLLPCFSLIGQRE